MGSFARFGHILSSRHHAAAFERMQASFGPGSNAGDSGRSIASATPRGVFVGWVQPTISSQSVHSQPPPYVVRTRRRHLSAVSVEPRPASFCTFARSSFPISVNGALQPQEPSGPPGVAAQPISSSTSDMRPPNFDPRPFRVTNARRKCKRKLAFRPLLGLDALAAELGKTGEKSA
jgi:hypothetical protein